MTICKFNETNDKFLNRSYIDLKKIIHNYGRKI